MRLDPQIYSRESILQYQRAQRRYARMGPVGVAAGLLCLLAAKLNLEALAIAFLLLGGVIIGIMSIISYKEIRVAYKQLQREKKQWDARRPRN
jgi:hypothetical protein